MSASIAELREACAAAARACQAISAVESMTAEGRARWLALADRALTQGRAALARLEAADPALLALAEITAEDLAGIRAALARLGPIVDQVWALVRADAAVPARGDATP